MEEFAAFTMGAENKDDLTILAMEMPIMIDNGEFRGENTSICPGDSSAKDDAKP